MKPLFLASLFLLSTGALAETNLSWEGYIKAGSFDVDDPDGSTDATFSGAPGIKVIYPLEARGTALVSGVEFYSFDLDESTREIGQDVQGFRFWGGYEHRFNFSREVKVWAGVGLTIDSVDFDDRQTVAADGFLGETFDDRSETYVGGTLYANAYLDKGRSSYQPGIGVFVDVPFDDGVEAFGVLFSVRF